jgi:uncharacterized protein YggE
MEGLVNEGVNKIDNVVFQSSKLAQYQSEARKLARMLNSKQKTMSVLGKSRQSCNYYRQFTKLSTTALYARMKTMEMDESAGLEKHWLQVKLR